MTDETDLQITQVAVVVDCRVNMDLKVDLIKNTSVLFAKLSSF